MLNNGKPNLKSDSRWIQGKFKPSNPGKYIGNPTNIIFRSSWERGFLSWCDRSSLIVKYSSEELVIPYYSPIDGKYHRYFVDFIIFMRQADGSVKKYAVEIKPYSQTIPPRITKRILTEQVRSRLETYQINQAKWKAARAYCRQMGMDFVVLTEKNLILTGHSKRRKKK